VREDTDNDDIGDTGLANVQVELMDSTGTIITWTRTGSDGSYTFGGLLPGTFIVNSIQLPGYIDVVESDGVANNRISVTITNGNQHVTDKNFVDRRDTDPNA